MSFKYMIPVILATLFIVPMAFAQQEEEDPYRNLPPFVDDSRRFEVSTSYILMGTGMNFLHIEGGEESVNVFDQQRGAIELNVAYYFDRFKTFGVEALFGYTWALGLTQLPSEVQDPDNPVIYPVETIDHTMLTYGGNFVYNFGYLDIVPFVTVGAGLDVLRPSGDSDFPVDDTFWHLSFSLGFKYYFKEWVGARVSVDDYFYFIDSPNAAVGNTNQFRLKIGGVFTF